jgi:hypothetical protein
MTSPVRVRLVAAAASVGILVLLSGCSAINSLLPHTLSASAKPVAGDCWTSSVQTAGRAAAWTAGGAVPCSAKHQLATYAVVAVTSSATTWRTSDGNLDNRIATAAMRSCDKRFWKMFPEAQDNGRLVRYFFVAPEQQWKKGARWVRCDIGVLRTGSLAEDPEFASLPASIGTLQKQLESTPDLFANCVTTTDPSGNTGPYDDPDAVIADCTGEYQWRFESAFTIPGKPDDPYPDDDTFDQVDQSECGDAADEDGSDWVVYVPTEDQWAAGGRGASCWFLASTKPQA